MDRPVVWKMIDEAVDFYKGSATFAEIKKIILEKWDDVNEGTIRGDMQSITVNDNSRIHYGINHTPRLSNSNSRYDLLFKTSRATVERYDPRKHGIWEIYKDGDDQLGVRLYSGSLSNKVFTPADIVWFKNVSNSELGEAYLQLEENPFVIHFPTKHKTNVLSPNVDELILVYQKVDGVPAFTHIVTAVDNELVTDHSRPDYLYGRRVKIIAKTNKNNFIPVSSTLWERVTFSGITQGNACKLENIGSIGNVDELQFDIWQRFAEYFIQGEQQSAETTSAIIAELQLTNPDLSVIEGELRLVKHLVKERNRGIVVQKKQLAIHAGELHCEVCDFSFPEKYESNFIECHHLNPIGQGGIRETRLEDLALVCSNCHRMLHTKFDGQYLSVEGLQARMKYLQSSKKS